MDFQTKIRNFLQSAQRGASDFFQGTQQAVAPVAQNAVDFGSNLMQQVQPQQVMQAVSNPVGFGMNQVFQQPQIQQFTNPVIQSPPVQTFLNKTPAGAILQGQPQQFLPRAYKGLQDFGSQYQDNSAGRFQLAQDLAGGFGPGSLKNIGEAVDQPLKSIVAPKKTSLFNQFFDRTRNVIASQGQAGKELADRLQSARDTGETLAGKWVSQLPTVRNLSNKEFENFVDVAEGKAQPISQKVIQAANEWGSVRQQVYGEAQKAGLDIGQLENYFPHKYDPKMFEGDNFVKSVQHLIETGQAKTPEEASKMLRYVQDNIRNRRQGNLELHRIADLPGYDKTKNALFGYLESAGRRVGQVSQLGQQDSTAMELINKIGQQGGDATAAKSAFDIASGAKQYDEGAKQISGGLRKFQSLTKLGFGAISNTGQSVNTATVTGTLRTLMSMGKALTPEAQKFALKSGATLDGVLSDVMEGSGFTGKVLSKITAPGFNKVEKFNRTVAAWAGKSYAEDLAKQAVSGSQSAIRQLAKLGINPQEVITNGGRLTEQQQILAARRIVERTQFKVDPQDLPGWASSPYGKLFAQFKNFSYNQSAFIKNEILDEAKKGNVAPLVRYLAIGTLAGEGIADVKAFVRGRERTEDPAGRVTDNINTVGGAGLVADVVNASTRGPQGVLQFLGGPTMGEISKLAGGAGLASQGKPKTLIKAALSDIPVVGQTASNILYPPQNAYQSRTPDLPIENASASEFPAASLTGGPVYASDGSAVDNNQGQTKTLSILQKKQIEEKIAEINKQEKAVVDASGAFSLPFIGQIAGKTDSQKESQLSQLEAQKKAYQEQIAKPKNNYSEVDSQYSLLSDRLIRADNADSWLKVTDAYIEQLRNRQQELDPTKDKAKITSLQNKIEDLQAKSEKYKSYGGFNKPKKGKTAKGVNFLKTAHIKSSTKKTVKSLLPKYQPLKAPVVKKRGSSKLRLKKVSL